MDKSPLQPTKPNKLKVLPHRLALAALHQDRFAGCVHALLKLLLFPKSDDTFFSFTDTSEDISLVIEDEFVSLFPEEELQCTTQRWRAIQFDEGPLGFESTGIVSSVATPLAKAKIPLFYVSTFTTGYTLVEEDILQNAVECLKSAGFIFSNDPVTPVSTSALKVPTLAAEKRKAYPVSPSFVKTQMVITKLPYQLYMANISKKKKGDLAKDLIRLLFYPEEKKRFFSFTETPDEVSLILDEESASSFPKDSLTLCNVIWRALQISEGSYGSHGSETISKFAQPLANACISIFNVSTYFNDYTLVAESNMEKSLTELRSKLNIILDEDEFVV